MYEETDKMDYLNKILLIVSVVLILFIVSWSLIFIRSTKPAKQAEKEATELAASYADLQSVDEFFWFNREETYFSLTGRNGEGQAIAVIIPESGNNIKVLNQTDGLTSAQVRAVVLEEYGETTITKTSLGIYQDQPVWEVTTQAADGSFSYYLLSFEKGQEVKVIKNI